MLDEQLRSFYFSKVELKAMITFTDAIRQEVDLSLQVIREKHEDNLSKVKDAILVLEDVFDRLRNFIKNYQFENQSEEILFFKEIKPKLFSKLIYYQRLFHVIVERPPGGEKEMEAYLNKEVKYLFLFFDKNREFYQYYRSSDTHFDTCYFLRGRHQSINVAYESFYYERDPRFSTPCDFKLAKLIAYEEYEKTILKELEKLTGRYSIDSIPTFLDVKWTGSKTYLALLIYALHGTGMINKGRMTLNELKKKAEFIFNIDLGNISAILYEQGMRKNPGKFFDELKDIVIKLINRHLK